jgi:serine/threonine-protein kinase HipA
LSPVRACRPLSLSLPFNLNNGPIIGEKVANYFDNLLPDSAAIRARVATRFKTGSTDPFPLLRAIGSDCVGAIQLLEEGKAPTGLDKVEGVAVDEEAIERHLLEVVSPDRFKGAKDPDDDFRISLAGGFSEKVADSVLGGLLNAVRTLEAMPAV